MSEASATELWLIRHGQTEWSETGQHTGRTDIPLTETGREQAKALKTVLGHVSFDHLYSSPLIRACDTADLAGLGGSVVQEPSLLEWDYGVYEGRKTKDIRVTVPGWNVWDFDIPEGEDAADVEVRVKALAERLDRQGGRIALVAHAHILRSLAGYWVSGDIRFGRHLVLAPASISVLGYDRENRVIRRWNSIHY